MCERMPWTPHSTAVDDVGGTTSKAAFEQLLQGHLSKLRIFVQASAFSADTRPALSSCSKYVKGLAVSVRHSSVRLAFRMLISLEVLLDRDICRLAPARCVNWKAGRSLQLLSGGPLDHST